MSAFTQVALYSLLWLGFSLASGWWANRWSVERVGQDNAVTRLRDFEHGGRIYERIGIRRWKNGLPEAGDFFRGGMSKRHLPGRDATSLLRFAAETRRAELVHWMGVCFGATFLLWTPGVVGLVMVTFGVALNAPFIAIQRYNRARVARVLAINPAHRGIGLDSRRTTGGDAHIAPPHPSAPTSP